MLLTFGIFLFKIKYFIFFISSDRGWENINFEYEHQTMNWIVCKQNCIKNICNIFPSVLRELIRCENQSSNERGRVIWTDNGITLDMLGWHVWIFSLQLSAYCSYLYLPIRDIYINIYQYIYTNVNVDAYKPRSRVKKDIKWGARV